MNHTTGHNINERTVTVTIGKTRRCPCGNSSCYLYLGQVVTMGESWVHPKDREN